ncbi:MAG TPA: NAD(P)(+) transhydrogenase (Re/Si-specific) subunit beta [Actinocrinis sp.]|uniref:NAD(P)(+) transhydrogenase (Re/Si-specific) subunit beta n=1 Tax=Actinocrinis sp. TaxID=1920516 RepID=UPI002DDD3CA8|nr:NAD(P)(+) transhydrogenase (Re/Si-specific) subunit beta [Actinocrinis sp.]HEV2348173.1 NAD(P)(+) transhydrogenase (Re/Si-specific) subunit beta [Actinocrinis sp.]
MSNGVLFGDLIAAVCFILALKGLSAPRTARYGNWAGAAGAALAVIISLSTGHLQHVGLILLAVVIGAVIGVPAATRVKMTAMPQLVAIFNGVGGGAAAVVALVEFLTVAHNSSLISAGDQVATVFTILVGSVSFSGSMITFAKLQELMTTRPVVLPAGRWISSGVFAAAIVLGIVGVPVRSTGLLVVLMLVSLGLGVLFVLPVGGADVPIVISLLNAFTGLTVAASGYVLGNTLLIVAGTLVGASGTILTRLMAAAMGRPITGILFGAFRAQVGGPAAAAENRPVRSGTPEDIAILLGYARKVIIVPGYGLAVAQGQHTIRELADLLAARGVKVAYGIHPVAGRMPGHMNVLLAEANVPYEALLEMDEANSELSSADVALVVGANDVVNPAAKTTPGAPIYGMPIINVDQAAAVVFCKRSLRPGFAGIENELLYDPKTTLLFGDAKESLGKVVAAVKSL